MGLKIAAFGPPTVYLCRTDRAVKKLPLQSFPSFLKKEKQTSKQLNISIQTGLFLFFSLNWSTKFDRIGVLQDIRYTNWSDGSATPGNIIL